MKFQKNNIKDYLEFKEHKLVVRCMTILTYIGLAALKSIILYPIINHEIIQA